MECPSCNAYNPDGLISCTVCGAHLPKSNPVAAMAKPKLAIFHVEEAVLDNAAGERVAKRKGLKGKRFEREVAANLEKSVSRAGVRDYINKLSRDNFTIAFISSLDSSYQFRLQDRLRQLGYPVMADDSGPLVLMGSSQDNIRSLAKRYDINFAFGTSGAGTAKQLNVPGVYATVSDYIGNASNPYIAPQATPSPYSLSGLRPEPTPSTYTLANPANCGCGQDPCITYGPMPSMTNPPPKPRRQTSKKTGKKRRESAKKYFDRLMGNKMMNKEFPDNSQRSAVALRYVKEEYGQRGVNSVTKTWSPMDNPLFKKKEEPSPAVIKGVKEYIDWHESEERQRKEDAEIEGEEFTPRKLTAGSMVSEEEMENYGIAPSWKALGGDLFPLAEYLEGTLTIYGAPHFNESVEEVNLKGFKSLKSAVDSISEEKVSEGSRTALYEKISDWFDGFHHDPPGDGFSVTFSKRNLKTLQKLLDEHSPRSNPRKNPASPKKLKKAKDAYKKFHGGKTPDEIKTEKIDVGNVWYSLGECWTIGYMSPKENGNEHQKFIHEMNEESKDGNYPILYATMPEDGEPMLIIKGGSMKIGMRDGKAWLID